MAYVTTTEVKNLMTVPSTVVSDAMITSLISLAEREVDLETFTTYWNAELSRTATSATSSTLVDTTQTWTTNQYATNYYVKITGGTGSGQIRQIISNTSNSLTVDRNWTVTPTSSSTYTVYYTATNPYFSQSIDGNNMQWLFVPSYPIRTIESLSINSQSVTPSYVLTYDSGKIYLGTSAEYRYFDAKQPQLVSLSYWYGVLTVPAEVKQWVMLRTAQLCLQQLLSSSYNSPISYNMPEGSVSMKAPADSLKITLASYAEQLKELSRRLIRYQSLG